MNLINDFRIEFTFLSRLLLSRTVKDNYILSWTISLRDFLASFWNGTRDWKTLPHASDVSASVK